MEDSEVIAQGEPEEQEDALLPGLADESKRYEAVLTCADLTDAPSRTQCERELTDRVVQILLNNATSSYDVTACSKLPAFYAEQCKNQIEATGIKGLVSDEERKVFAEAIRPIYPVAELPEGVEAEELPPEFLVSDPEAEVAYDKSKCSALTTPGYKEYCEKQVQDRIDQQRLFSITRGDDVGKCDEIEEESLREACRFSFGIFPEPADPEDPDPEDLVVPTEQDATR